MVWEVEGERGKVHEIVRFFFQLLSFLASLSLARKFEHEGSTTLPPFQTSDAKVFLDCCCIQTCTGSTLVEVAFEG